jgi:hypothetical protein
VNPFVRLMILGFFTTPAGIQSPPLSLLPVQYRPEQFLEKLAKERTLVTCQLLSRQVYFEAEPTGASNPRKRIMEERLPELQDSKQQEQQIKKPNKDQQLAICRISYRPTLLQLFSSDIAESLLRAGKASASSSLVTATNLDEKGIPKSKIVDASQRIQDLRKDVKYLDRLAKVEFDAAKESTGMWSVPEVRATKPEVVEEAEFQTKANIRQKIWRWLRG